MYRDHFLRNLIMPILAVIYSRLSPNWNGMLKLFNMLSATRSPLSTLSSSHKINMNSPPPNLEIVSTSRIQFVRRTINSTNSLSPMSCPKESLISLKWSRSSERIANRCPVRCYFLFLEPTDHVIDCGLVVLSKHHNKLVILWYLQRAFSQ